MITKFEQFINENLKIEKSKLNDSKVQKILNQYIDDLPLFRDIIEKGMSNVDRNVELYYDNDEFIGYYVYMNDLFKFNQNRQPSFEGETSYKTLNITDIEIRDSIRKDKSRPRYGKIIIDKIIQDAKLKYDGITLQANNDELLTKVYPKYGFVDMKFVGNGMVLWFK